MKKLLPSLITMVTIACSSATAQLPKLIDGNNGASVGNAVIGNTFKPSPRGITHPNISSGPQVIVYTIPVWGPPTNSPAYLAWASSTVESINYGTNTTVRQGTNSWYLATGDFIQGPDGTNNTLWFSTEIISANTNLFSPNWLSFAESSSDAGHRFSYSFAYTNENYVYTPQAIGEVNGLLLTSGYWPTPVSKFIYIGNQSKYFTCSTGAESNSVDGFFSTVPGMAITGTFTLNDGVNPPVSASKTFYRTGGPAPLKLTIINNPLVLSAVGLSAVGGSTNDTWTVQESRSLTAPIWADLATANYGWSLAGLPATNSSDFFRAVLQ